MDYHDATVTIATESAILSGVASKTSVNWAAQVGLVAPVNDLAQEWMLSGMTLGQITIMRWRLPAGSEETIESMLTATTVAFSLTVQGIEIIGYDNVRLMAHGQKPVKLKDGTTLFQDAWTYMIIEEGQDG